MAFLSTHMELKKYQKTTLEELKKYLAKISDVRKYDVEKAAGMAFMIGADKQYNWIPELGRSPFVCVKVPTGGGKTFIAVHSVGVIFKDYLGETGDRGLVMWFTPSDAIRTQTLNNLRDRNHFYREVLDARFDGAVKVFDLAEAKAIKRDDLADNLCIVVSTLGAFRRENKEWLKVYKDNGALLPHFEGLDPVLFDFLDKDKNGEIIYSLANVIRIHNPLVIVDEGHNAQTDLSFEMLKGLNPSFILEFTATPRGKSNVLVSVSANELKDEKMIKMPIYLANKTPWQETIYEGIYKLRDLEKRAKQNKGEYIRPIMLLQAEQEKENRKKIFVERIYKFLTDEANISPEKVAIQTGKIKDLPNMKTLLSPSCPIRYIITVNALREGWDCPFAYVLVSVSNLGAPLSVEQTIGRIMRLPNAKEKNDSALNSAYIFASTNNFNRTSEMVIRGLRENGYEDIAAIAGSVSVGAREFKKKIDDKKIVIPFINIKDGEKLRRLDYVGDLIGNARVLEGQSSKVDFQPADDNRVIKIDIGREGGGLIKDAAGRLGIVYHRKDITKDDLLVWFFVKVQRGFIAIDEMSSFVEKVIDKLLARHSLSLLSAHFYQIKDLIDNKINEIVDKLTEKKFSELSEKGLLISSGEGFIFGESVNLPQISSENFSKHLYEKAGIMNGEELDLASRLDALENIRWWFRNPALGGFYIQGWLKNKFYPDFIVKTKSGKYIVLEYKGEHISSGDDSEYKKKIGKKWEELSGGDYFFRWVERDGIDKVIGEISKM